MKVLPFCFIVIAFLMSCESQSPYSDESTKNQVLILHRPYSISSNISSDIKSFVFKTLGIHLKDSFVTSYNDFERELTSESNLIVLAERFSAYQKKITDDYQQIIISPTLYEQLYLIKNKRENFEKDTLILFTSKKNEGHFNDFDFLKIFQKTNMPNLKKITNSISEVTKYEYAIVDQATWKSLKSSNQFHIISESDKIYQNSWLISKHLVYRLNQKKQKDKFMSVLKNYPLDFLSTEDLSVTATIKGDDVREL